MDAATLVQLAPTILSFLGPLGTAAGVGLEFLGDKLGLTDKTKESINNAVQGMTADQSIQLRKLELDFQQFCLTNSIQVDLGQIEVNKTEAANTSVFVSGWRPFVGWVGGFALAYVSIIDPMAKFVATVMFHYTGAFPIIDTTITMQVLLGILGLGAMRSYDKTSGNGSGH